MKKDFFKKVGNEYSTRFGYGIQGGLITGIGCAVLGTAAGFVLGAIFKDKYIK